MTKTRTFKRIIGAVTAAALSLTALSFKGNLLDNGYDITASATDTSTYTITIPSTLTVANSGWNSIGNISASGSLADGKKLNITATSENSFALKSGNNSVSYTIKNASTDTKATTSWDFTKEQLAANDGATQAIGIDVSDYSSKPAGTYQDTVTFTAKVEDAVVETLLTTITATGKEQASYSTANVATVSFSYLPYCDSAYLATWGWWGYGWTATVTPADGYTITKCVFYDDKDRTATDSEAPFVVETTEEDKTPQVNGTPILANTSKGITKIEVYGYAN